MAKVARRAEKALLAKYFRSLSFTMFRSYPISSFAALGFFLTLAKAETDPTPDQYCLVGCQTTLYTQTFAGSPSAVEDPYAEPCQNELHVSSIFVCAREYCSSTEVKSGWKYVNEQCEAYGYPLLSLDIVANLTAADIQQLPVLEYGDLPVMINTTMLPSQDLFELGYRTITVWYDTKGSHLWYSKAMFIFWGAVISLGVCTNIFTWMRSGLGASNLSPEGPISKSPSVIDKLRDLIRSHFLLPATFGQNCAVSVWQATLPPRAEFTIISIFVILNIVLSAVSYTTFDRNLYWAGTTTQIWRYLADRFGHLSYANLTIFWAFGIRNNLLIWATGWNFPTFTRFHRWVARVATLQAVLHSIAYTVESFLSGGLEEYTEEFAYQYWYCGVIAAICMSLVLVFSMLWIRVKFYDIFLLLHIGLALMILVNLFYHTKIFLGEYDGFLWPCVAFWVFDRVCRIGRVVYSMYRAARSKALADFSTEDKIIRIDATDVFASRKVAGGVHFFLYSPLTLFGWQSHPFTLVRWKESAYSTGSSSPTEIIQGHKEINAAVSNLVTSAAVEDAVTRYSFLLRPMTGYTLKLSKALQGSSPKPTTFLYEGPYGHAPRLQRFSNVLLLIGGSGISVGISCIYDALEHNPNISLHLVWTCGKSATFIDSIMERELALAMETGRLAVDVSITASSSVPKGAACKSVTRHRPDIAMVIHDAVANKTSSLAVVVCGPASLTDDARAAFVHELAGDKGDVELFLESFNW